MPIAINRLTAFLLAGLCITVFLTHTVVQQTTGQSTIQHISKLSKFLPSKTVNRWADLYVSEDDFPETTHMSGVAGFNYFHNLYSANGTFLIVTSNPESLPSYGISGILSALSDPLDKYHNHAPAGEDRIMIVSPQEAKERMLLGKAAIRKSGVSLMFADVKEGTLSSFLNHYYHFIGEMFLGLWRVVTAAGEIELPSRLIYRAESADWRDRAGITTWFQQAVLPEAEIEEATIYEDRKKSGVTFLFDKIAIADRWAAHRIGQEVKYWNKANADLPLLDVPLTWMDPLRDQIKRLALAEGCDVKRKRSKVPVVTYINRQLTSRRLIDEDDQELIEEMEKLDDEGVIEFHNAFMEKLPRVDQFCLVMKTDVMFGVHGNGLSHQLWMKPKSAVMEIMPVNGFARDYAILGEMMNHEYYAIHYNETFPPEKWRKENGYGVDQGPDFHSPRYTIDGKWMAGMVRELVSIRINAIEPPLPW
ncbi:uncharacterized protein I206_106326 [Kwoniella pini CBS 10737]|uniref:Glycosyltransferase 61 catalytic domain-containing protein n=1 Tax=Kwoniella pini CBS 10737 TaxID=1296096 RepID=A0A1B9HU00_9TREE|nr:uncharacterized protein I206_07127 [Kwoniella pini CBS 10737]OCF46740.1 hypothetical protein I206_07127 [Kwoniella pini CBS 10737]